MIKGVVEHQGALPDVRKADQVPDRIKELIADHVQLTRPFSRDKRAGDWGFTLPAEDFVRTSAFLKASYQEKKPARAATRGEQARQPSVSAPPQRQGKSSAAFVCRQCQSPALDVAFGRSYYFKCRDCQGNTPIHLTCPKCQSQQRTRKSGQQFFAECAGCGTSRLYFTNI